MDKLQAMRTFVRIVDDGSLSAAARSLNASVPAVVRSLAGLEAELQTRLLNRTTRRQGLTDEGRGYLEHCRRILADIDAAEAALRERHEEPSGTLHVTAPVLLGQMWVAPAVNRFVRRYGRVQCRLLLVDRLVNLVEEGLDVAIRIDHLADSSLVSQQAGSVRRVVVASPDYLQRHGVPRHPRELLRANCISTGRPWPFRDGGHEFTLPVAGNLDFNVGAPALQACVDGLGFGMFLSYQVAQEVAQHRLHIVLQDFERPPLPLNVVYPHARLLARRTRLFVDWMKTALAPVV